VSVGNEALFEGMDERYRHPSVGVAVDPTALSAALPLSSPRTDRTMRLGLATNALNHLLFLLTEQSWEERPSGLLDLDLSAPFFAQLGFDFVTACDAPLPTGQERSPLCTIRPRVGELLGSALSSYKYFAPNYPLMMSLRGNRALPPHIKIVSADEVPVVSRVAGLVGASEVEDVPQGNLVDFQLGGITISFYALEVDKSAPLDEYGNPVLVLDEKGAPRIKSLRPDDPDPYRGQIISFELTLLLALEIGDVVTDPTDPARFILSLRPLADRSRLVLTPVAGSNATTVPPEGLVSALREKLTYAISIFSARAKAIKIPIPKVLALAPKVPTPDSLMSMLGLKDFFFDDEGLAMEWSEASSYLTIDLAGTIRQMLADEEIQ
jgi:hypothetical protein